MEALKLQDGKWRTHKERAYTGVELHMDSILALLVSQAPGDLLLDAH